MDSVFTPMISVIMAVYNGENRVVSAIRSVINQDIDNWELIVVNDGSIDKTKEVIEKISDPRIHLINLEKNIGLGAARNIGLKASRGKWVTFLDDDDQFEPNRLSTLLDIGNRVSCNGVVDNKLIIEEHSQRIIGYTLKKENNETKEWPFSLKDFLLMHCPVLQPMIKMEFLQRYDLVFPEDRQYLEDLHFWIDILLQGAKFVCTSKALYWYTYRKGSLSHNRVKLNRRKMQSLILLAHKAEEKGFFYEAHLMYKLAEEANLATNTWGFIGLIKNRQFKNAICIITKNPKILIVTLNIIFNWVKSQVKRLSLATLAQY